MIRALRPFLCLLTAIAFAISSVGWSAASARVTAAPVASMHHAATAGAKADGDRHHTVDRASVAVAPCDGSNTPCSDEAAPSCCAMACHIAIEVSTPEAPYDAIFGEADRGIGTPGLPMAMTGRLDRPPRHADAAVG